MNTTFDLRTVLQSIENRDNLDYGQVTDELDKITDAEIPPSTAAYADLTAEKTAFRFAADSEFARDNWGTYYGPWSVIRVNADTVSISPHIDKISPEMIE